MTWSCCLFCLFCSSGKAVRASHRQEFGIPSCLPLASPDTTHQSPTGSSPLPWNWGSPPPSSWGWTELMSCKLLWSLGMGPCSMYGVHQPRTYQSCAAVLIHNTLKVSLLLLQENIYLVPKEPPYVKERQMPVLSRRRSQILRSGTLWLVSLNTLLV